MNLKTSCLYTTGGTSHFLRKLIGVTEFQKLLQCISGFSRLTLQTLVTVSVENTDTDSSFATHAVNIKVA